MLVRCHDSVARAVVLPPCTLSTPLTPCFVSRLVWSIERVIVNTLILAITAQRWAVAHPKLSLSAAGAVVTYRSLKKAKKNTGIMLSSNPLRSVFRPPIPHLASLLNGPFARAEVTGDMDGAASMGFEGEAPAGTEEVLSYLRNDIFDIRIY